MASHWQAVTSDFWRIPIKKSSAFLFYEKAPTGQSKHYSQQVSRQWGNDYNQGKLVVIGSMQASRTSPSRFATCTPLFNTPEEKKRPPSSLPSFTWILLQSHLQQTGFLRFTKGSQLIILWLQWTQSGKDCQASLGWITFQWFIKALT